LTISNLRLYLIVFQMTFAFRTKMYIIKKVDLIFVSKSRVFRGGKDDDV
jgi:hypothetical protein